MIPVSINTYDEALGRAPESAPSGPRSQAWLLGKAGVDMSQIHTLAPPEAADLNEWQNERVGWGVIVLAKEGFTSEDYAKGKDLEGDEQLEKLLDHRRTIQGRVPVFHYDPKATSGPQTILLRNHATTNPGLDFTSKIGLGPAKLPFYLLIYAPPSAIPWSFQSTLQLRHAVGRLDPGMPGLNHYIDHLIQGWKPAPVKPHRTLVWAVDHGAKDITSLMRQAVATRLHALYAGDVDIEAVMLDATVASEQGEGDALIAKLAEHRPELVITSSHGKTTPLGDKAQLAATLGIPMDQLFRWLDLDALLKAWQPAGAVWFAQACCSAGSDSPSRYADLFTKESEVGSVLHGVAESGAYIAPLPQRLLGCENPARGFFGHVEPTFDLTLRNPLNKQILSHPVVEAFYDRYFGKFTLGRVLNDYHQLASTKFSQWQILINRFNAGEDVDDELLYLRTTAIDMDSLVLIGDPTAAFAAS